MLDYRDADATEAMAWEERWRARLTAWFASYGYTEVATLARIETMLGHRRRLGGESRVLILLADGQPVGTLAIRSLHEVGLRGCLIDDVYIDPAYRRRGLARAALSLVRQVAGDLDRIQALVDPGDPAQVALARNGKRVAQTMIKVLRPDAPKPALPEGVTGRPMDPEVFAQWRAAAEHEYGTEIADSGALPPKEAAVRAAQDFDAILPQGLRTPDHTFWIIEAGGTRVGAIWLQHQRTGGTGWVFGVDVEAAHRGHGYGKAAMIIGERACLAAGDTALALNVFGHNEVAIGLYNGLGYRTVHQDMVIDAA